MSEESVPDTIPFVFSDLDHDGVPDVYSEERYALVLSTQNALLGHQEGANFRIHVQDEEGVQVNDNVSRVQVEVIRIDDLSSESSRVVRPGDVSDWHDTYADYVTLLQSPVTLSR